MLCLSLGIVSTTIAADSYIASYAPTVRRHEFKAVGGSLEVQEGVVIVDAESLGPVDRTKVMTVLESIPTVVRVEFREGQTHTDVRERQAHSAKIHQARVTIPSARPHQPHDTRSIHMRSVQRASGRVRADTSPWTGVSPPPCR